QVLVTRQRMQRAMGTDGPRSMLLASFFGFISSSCSFAALVILATGWMPIDPLLSVLMALLILRSAWKLTRESGPILLEGPRRASTPRRCAARFPSSSRRSATCITCPSGR
ncbi:MAG: hypothetical protein R3215_11600, partial [Halomonas sp.]|nr:hypothetical protein [Halomonas sp.]